MATVVAIIKVTFTSNYVGCHRLFWRRIGDAEYNGPVLAVPECSGKGNPCSISFSESVTMSPPGDTLLYEGYVQACCEEEDSLDGRIPWSATHTPTLV